ncbi:IS66 family insertion sequence element accessory protein TnpB, partial [Thiolapillus sp.]|uniref:IS66 family insertion sequence element accessory protein TnpB n=1 Tax=Thiolapillus sp. TaxID=2017437 RepID=UPI003AF4DBCD
MEYRLRPHPQMPRIYLYQDPVDFRKSFRSLAAIVEQELGHNPFEGALYAFTNRRRDKIKLLYQACLRPRDRFWDIPVPKIDSAFDNLLVPQPSRLGHQALRNNFASSLLLRTWLPYDWTPRSEAYFVFPLAQGTP